jgi:hypothetical protein
MGHVCNSRCGGGAHCELHWLRPLGEVLVFTPHGPGDPYEPSVVRATLSVIFHRFGWRVKDAELATEAGPCPWPEHTEPWLVTVEPCPDCGPPVVEPFGW